MYSYEKEKESLFNHEGQLLFLKIRDKAHLLLQAAGAFRMQEAVSGNSGSSWQMLACVDRLVEIGEIREIQQNAPGQHRIFVSAKYED